MYILIEYESAITQYWLLAWLVSLSIPTRGMTHADASDGQWIRDNQPLPPTVQ